MRGKVKEVKKSSQDESFYLTIIESIRKGNSPADMCKSMNISKQSLNYYLSTLKRIGCIRKIGYGVWEILKDFNEKEVKISKKTTTVTPNKYTDEFLPFKEDSIRGHAFVFRFQIRKGIQNWNKRYELINEKYPELKPKQLNGGVSILFKERKIHLWNESIVIYETMSYTARIASEAKSTALYEVQELLMSLENKLGSPRAFMVRNGYKFRVRKEHYSMVKNALARQYRKDGKKLDVYNDSGQWMLIDNSHNLMEWEIIRNKEDDAVKTSESVQNFWNDHKSHNFEVTATFVLNVMNGIQQNQLVFDSNMSTHLKVLTDIGTQVNELGTVVSSLNETIRELKKNWFTRLYEGLMKTFK